MIGSHGHAHKSNTRRIANEVHCACLFPRCSILIEQPNSSIRRAAELTLTREALPLASLKARRLAPNPSFEGPSSRDSTGLLKKNSHGHNAIKKIKIGCKARVADSCRSLASPLSAAREGRLPSRYSDRCIMGTMEFPAALPLVEAGMQRPGIVRHLSAAADWVAQGAGAPRCCVNRRRLVPCPYFCH